MSDEQKQQLEANGKIIYATAPRLEGDDSQLMAGVAKWILTFGLAMTFLFIGIVHANDWSSCKMEVLVMDKISKPYPALQVKVLSVLSKDTECPLKDEILTYRPESSDYQSELKMRDWPQKGSRVKIRYIYLDGICKNDGYDRACRIKHYPSGW